MIIDMPTYKTYTLN